MHDCNLLILMRWTGLTNVHFHWRSLKFYFQAADLVAPIKPRHYCLGQQPDCRGLDRCLGNASTHPAEGERSLQQLTRTRALQQTFLSEPVWYSQHDISGQVPPQRWQEWHWAVGRTTQTTGWWCHIPVSRWRASAAYSPEWVAATSVFKIWRDGVPGWDIWDDLLHNPPVPAMCEDQCRIHAGGVSLHSARGLWLHKGSPTDRERLQSQLEPQGRNDRLRWKRCGLPSSLSW